MNDNVILSKGSYASILEFLTNRPYKEVAGLIATVAADRQEREKNFTATIIEVERTIDTIHDDVEQPSDPNES